MNKGLIFIILILGLFLVAGCGVKTEVSGKTWRCYFIDSTTEYDMCIKSPESDGVNFESNFLILDLTDDCLSSEANKEITLRGDLKPRTDNKEYIVRVEDNYLDIKNTYCVNNPDDSDTPNGCNAPFETVIENYQSWGKGCQEACAFQCNALYGMTYKCAEIIQLNDCFCGCK